MRAIGGHATLQAIINTHLSHYRKSHSLSPRQWQVCRHIVGCRTAAMGSARLSCTHCGVIRDHHYACRDRHCPMCQQQASQQWSEKQAESMLPVTYHHLVFTLPHELNAWVDLHPNVIYGLLFRCVWSTLKRFGENPRYLGGKIGATTVLHTWGENLSRHVHLHCLIPGGALTPTGDWAISRSNYLFPVRALSRRFRGAMVSALREAADAGQLHRVTVPRQIDSVLSQLMKKEWAVYSKPCEQRTKQVIQYLGRYTHRVAISNQRIEYVDDQLVRFSAKDYRNNAKRQSLTLPVDEFIRRFLMHVLPKGFMRIRHYGLLSNRTRREKIAQIRLLMKQPAQLVKTPNDTNGSGKRVEFRCPRCLTGVLQFSHTNSHGPPKLVTM